MFPSETKKGFHAQSLSLFDVRHWTTAPQQSLHFHNIYSYLGKRNPGHSSFHLRDVS